MHGQTHGGKGSAQRTADRISFENNWELIFGKKDTPNITENVDEYAYTCTSCDTHLTEGQTYKVQENESYDIGDQRVWETLFYVHCELCNSNDVEEYVAVCE